MMDEDRKLPEMDRHDALKEPEIGGFEGFEQQKPVDFVIIEDQLKRIAKWLE